MFNVKSMCIWMGATSLLLSSFAPVVTCLFVSVHWDQCFHPFWNCRMNNLLLFFFFFLLLF
ncbi:hypothetical protein DsansV1_C04g0046081 [Dioscorea sansibarensis]